jgi:hypothetical protein
MESQSIAAIVKAKNGESSHSPQHATEATSIRVIL